MSGAGAVGVLASRLLRSAPTDTHVTHSARTPSNTLGRRSRKREHVFRKAVSRLQAASNSRENANHAGGFRYMPSRFFDRRVRRQPHPSGRNRVSTSFQKPPRLEKPTPKTSQGDARRLRRFACPRVDSRAPSGRCGPALAGFLPNEPDFPKLPPVVPTNAQVSNRDTPPTMGAHVRACTRGSAVLRKS